MSSVSDRYRVIERIGAGGLGVVNRVEDRATGRILAMKIMPRARGAANLRGEFLALARLRHDNIVAVLDYGLTESGHDFFTMEHVEGPPLLSAVDEIPSNRFYLLIGGVLRALAFVHARGMVHADIKPSNILVDAEMLASDPSRAARLADFGLAAAVEDPASTAVRGTFPYAAPEVYAGRLDARSDLYALGIVLYEMACGTPPYGGRNVREVLAAQRRGAPVDPREHAPQLPEPLAELILGLCDPAPGARPQTADEVLARINEIAGTDFAIADTRPLVDLSGVLVGRERDFSELQRMWRDAKEGRGCAALLCGEEGIGKSRLMAELKLFGQLDGGQAFVAEVATRQDRPYAGVSELVRGILASLSKARDAVGEWRRTLAPMLGARGEAPDVERSSRFALAEAVTGVLTKLGASQPLIVLVDDVHLADPATIELLAYLARSVAESSILLLMAARTGAGGDAGIAPLEQAMRTAERGQRIDLPPIDRAGIHRLTAQAFGDKVAETLANQLYRSSGGNPAHATRALEQLVANGTVARERGRWILRDDNPAIPVPDDARAIAISRFESLPDSARRILRVSSVLGERFRREVLLGLCGDSDAAELDESLSEAVRRRILDADVGSGMFRFAPRGLAARLYDSLPIPERQALHARAAALLAAASHPEPATLAVHYLALDERELATRWGLAAAREHEQSFDHHGALAWYRRIRPLLTDTAQAADVDERLGDLYSLIGDVTDALECYRDAYRARADDPADHIRLARRLGELHRRLGDGDAALQLLMDALREARQHKLGEHEAQCHLRIAWVLMYRADYKAALEHTVAGQLIAHTLGDRRALAELGRVRAAIAVYQGDPRGALSSLDEALSHAESTGDELLIAGILHEIGRAAIQAGDYVRAIDALEKAMPATERVGHIEQAARSLNNLGAACYYQGDWQRARESWERFRRLCERLDEQSELVNALNNLGSLYRELGQLSDAITVLDRGAHVAEMTGHTHMAAMIVGNRGETLFKRGDLAAARDCYKRALEEFQRIGAREDIIETRRRLSELDIAAGRIDEALDRAIDAAREAKDAGARREEGILHRVVAHALRLQGDHDSAVWFIERARELLTTIGARYERAKVELEAAELAAARGGDAEVERYLGAAIDGFAALGARWDLGVARARQRALVPAARPAFTGIATAESTPKSATGGLDLLLELTQAVANVAVDRLLEIALDKILALSRFDRGFLLLLDHDGRPLERLRRVRPGASGFKKDEAEFSGTIVRRVAASGKAASVSDIADEDELKQQKSVIALGLRQIMCAPMRSHGRVIGIIYIDSRRNAFAEQPVDLTLLEAFAAQVALALENSRLIAEERRKSELMSILAHEIRNPLSGILGYADMGEHPEDLESFKLTTGELFRRIRGDAERLRRLVDNVLELARHEAGNIDWSITTFDMQELVEDAVASYRPTCEARNIRIEARVEGLDRSALGNPDRIMQVVSNLLNNAVKFTGKDGTIRVRARVEQVTTQDPEAPPLRGDELGAWAPVDPDEGSSRSFIRVDVQDSGPGMSEEVRARLFEKFSQGSGKRRTAGIGLGLYISREIIGRHGGSIWVESELGHGATFSFRIPVA